MAISMRPENKLHDLLLVFLCVSPLSCLCSAVGSLVCGELRATVCGECGSSSSGGQEMGKRMGGEKLRKRR